MFWIICGIIAAMLYIYTAYVGEDEITALNLLVAILIVFLGWFALLLAIVLLITSPEEFSWTNKLKNLVIYDKD